MIAGVAFVVVALAAVWVPREKKIYDVLVVGAAAIALYGLHSNGWIGWGWSWAAWWWYFGFIAGSAVVLELVYGHDFSWRFDLDEFGGNVLWAAVQQGILLGFLLQVNVILAIIAFPLLHIPNRLLTAVTLSGGLASVLIGMYVEVSIPAAAIAHAALSLTISLGMPRRIHQGLCVGRGCVEMKIL